MELRIKQRRKALGLSQVELSKKSGVSRATINALENEKLEITTTDTLIKIANALKCKVSDIFFRLIV